MNKVRLLSTAAAMLMLGAGAAYAQAPAPQRGEAPTQPAPAAQQNAPAEKVAPPVKPSASAKPAASGHEVQKLEPGHGQSAQTGAQAGPHHGGADAAAKADMKGSAEPHKADIKTNADANKKAEGRPSSTTGQGAAASAKLSTEQRTKITTIFREKNVEPAHVNVSISIGTRIPDRVHYYPLPTEVVTIYPEWRGYDYILVGDQIVVVDPETHEIVAILEA